MNALDWLTILLALAVGWYGGYVAAHHEVARECERLGGFYVGSTVFVCQVKDAR